MEVLVNNTWGEALAAAQDAKEPRLLTPLRLFQLACAKQGLHVSPERILQQSMAVKGTQALEGLGSTSWLSEHPLNLELCLL